jgi:hypothetical protein
MLIVFGMSTLPEEDLGRFELTGKDAYSSVYNLRSWLSSTFYHKQPLFRPSRLLSKNSAIFQHKKIFEMEFAPKGYIP